MSTFDTIVSQKGLEAYKTLELAQNETLLISAYSFVWRPDARVTSVCPKCGNTPRKECSCGIYAHKTLEIHRKSGYVGNVISIVVKLELWGVVHEFTEGYRAQHARVVEIIVHAERDLQTLAKAEAIRERLEIAYVVPVSVFETDLVAREAQYYQRQITVEDLETSLKIVDDKQLLAYARKELKKRYGQKLGRLAKRIEAYQRGIEVVKAEQTALEAKRRAL